MQLQDIGRLTDNLLTLLDLMAQVDDMQDIKQLMAAWHGLLPGGTRTLLVVGVEGAAQQPTEILANIGWSDAWSVGYARSQSHRIDPVWNGRAGQLLVWSPLLHSASGRPGMRQFLKAATAERLDYGVSWIEQRGGLRIILSLAGRAVETDPVTAQLVATLAPRLANIVARELAMRPTVDGLDQRDCSILQKMLMGLGDEEIAQGLEISVRTVRARINRIRGLRDARNRVDLVRRLYKLDVEAMKTK